MAPSGKTASSPGTHRPSALHPSVAPWRSCQPTVARRVLRIPAEMGRTRSALVPVQRIRLRHRSPGTVRGRRTPSLSLGAASKNGSASGRRRIEATLRSTVFTSSTSIATSRFAWSGVARSSAAGSDSTTERRRRRSPLGISPPGMETSRSRSSDRRPSAYRTRYPRGISPERIRSSRLMHAHVRWSVGRTCPGTAA